MIADMWTAARDFPFRANTLRLRFCTDNRPLNYKEFLSALGDEDFRNLLILEMAAAPFSAYRWESPPLTVSTLDQAFECLLHDSPDLDVAANPTDFQSYFKAHSEVVCFDNLGADALLVVPCPIADSVNYSHIAAFHRTAPQSQLHAFWSSVADAVKSSLSTRPLWLSTAGGGVDWLHMRLDTRPKYYRHLAWRKAPDGCQ